MSKIQTRQPEDSRQVLFFGRSNCDATKKALTHLNALGFEVLYIESSGRGEEIPRTVDNWSGAYIFCFRSLFILPKSVLDKARLAAINFHPAPVEYPGSGCLNFALYDQAENYGVTAHLMNEKVDNGEIIECRRFPILPNDNVETLLERTHIKLLDLFFDVVADVGLNGFDALRKKLEFSSGEKWKGDARKMKDYEKLKRIPLNISESEMKKVVRATYIERWPPSINLHGYEFFLKIPKV